MENTEWLKEIVNSYNTLNNLNEGCVECNESAEQLEEAKSKKEEECIQRLMDSRGMKRPEAWQECNRQRTESTEQLFDAEQLEEEITDEDFMITLLEDVQAAVGEELTEEEVETILETVSLVVEGMVKKMKKKY